MRAVRGRGRDKWTWVGVVVVALVWAMLLAAGPALAAEPIKARLSYHWFPQHHAAIYADKFAKECEAATNGNLKIEVFHSGQLYGIREAVSAVSTGSVEMAGVLDLNFVPVDKNFMLGLMAYFWDGYAKQREFWTTVPAGKAKWDGIQKKLGIKILCYDPVGPICIFSTKKLTGTVEELKGRKIRYLSVAEKPGYAALGMSMVSVSTGEIFTALKQGMIDTLSTNPSAIKAYSWWDFMKNAEMPYTSYVDAFVVANAKWWDGLPADIQKTILTQVSPKVSQEATDSIIQSSNDMLKEFTADHGGNIVKLPPAELKKMVQIYKTKAWPALAKDMDPAVYQAALEFTGNK